jgi:hypothetical protein
MITLSQRKIGYPPNMPKGVVLSRKWIHATDLGIHYQQIGLRRMLQLLSEPGSVLILAEGGDGKIGARGRIEVGQDTNRVFVGSEEVASCPDPMLALDGLYRNVHQRKTGRDPGPKLSRWELPSKKKSG